MDLILFSCLPAGEDQRLHDLPGTPQVISAHQVTGAFPDIEQTKLPQQVLSK